MNERYFQPWVGKNYPASRILLLSESTYDWLNDEGEVATPQSTHPGDSLLWNVEHFGRNRYFTQMNRSLCGKHTPSVGEMMEVWQDLAYTIFVQDSVGFGSGVRPAGTHWQQAGPHFLNLLEELRPTKVIVTGKEMWDRMPDCSVRLVDDIQAYKLKDNSLIWCLALPHPANRTQGFSWEAISASISLFRAAIFPAS